MLPEQNKKVKYIKWLTDDDGIRRTVLPLLGARQL
jgi:hypothetical protein